MQSTDYNFQHHPPDLRQYEQGQISKKPPTKFRTRFPQFLANLTSNLLVLDLCMSYGFTTVVIAALLDVPDAEFPLDNTAASWLGSLAYICQPIGSVMSGMIVEYFGRKWSMIIVNLPFLVGWIIYSVSNSVAMLYVANVILGVGIGFMEAPIMTYIAETCQPEIRQILSTSISISIQLSFFIVYLLGTLTGWRTTAAISAGLPILTALYVTQMPETPIYLISRGKIKEAENALCWLRGWVAPEFVRKEFNELVKYNDASSKKITMIQLATVESSQGKIPEVEALHEENTQETAYSDDNEGHGAHCSMQLLREMIKPPTLRPLLLVLPYFLLYQFGCMAGMRAYLVHVFRELGLEDMSEWTAVGSAVIGMIGALFLITTVNWLGKRLISFISFTGNCIACILLAVYCFVVLRPGGASESSVTWVPLTLIITYSFFSSVTFAIPWAMMCEVFPFRTRGIASGFSAAMCYVFLFLASKTYLDLESSLELYGVFIFFAVLNLIAVVFVYFRMPPMEGKTLAEIEEYFSGQSKEFPSRS